MSHANLDNQIRAKLINGQELDVHERQRLNDLAAETPAQKLLRRERERAELPRGQREPTYPPLNVPARPTQSDLSDASAILAGAEDTLAWLRKQFADD